MHENNVSQGRLKAFKGTLTQWSLVRAIETSLQSPQDRTMEPPINAEIPFLL